MNKIQSKVKDWIISHFKHADKMENIDHVLLDFVVVTIPMWVMQMMSWGIMAFIYMWLYNKYGFEKVIILLFINLIMSIGFLRKALT